MARRYEEAPRARFAIRHVDGIEQIRIPARRSAFVLVFLCIWLAGWTAGGVAALYEVVRTGDAFLLLWLTFWAVGWLFVAATILWQLSGAETIAVVTGDLEIGHRMLGLSRRRYYRGAEIRRLAAEAPAPLAARMQAAPPPFLGMQGAGSIRFDYGARTIRAAAGLDRPEAEAIVAHLRARLPLAAVEP
ncbi:hypothetical protein E2493_20600 [Sphingomonas parva]|uniref:PH domain-containing protein n=1 Tax=Sphingomonas parva TaxID=2555898 RepID=A0A4Y8ZK62_9SPHN|nr:hypothetical protein [Sphingomonas parva]TFI56368.1 hypothetical protein E2493_20600 [Sphingomonas parva]